jgi:hypothetical protein
MKSLPWKHHIVTLTSCVTTAVMTENYALGHSPAEIRRLVIQAAILRPITMRLLHSFGPGFTG